MKLFSVSVWYLVVLKTIKDKNGSSESGGDLSAFDASATCRLLDLHVTCIKKMPQFTVIHSCVHKFTYMEVNDITNMNDIAILGFELHLCTAPIHINAVYVNF